MNLIKLLIFLLKYYIFPLEFEEFPSTPRFSVFLVRRPVGLRSLPANLIDILLYGDYQRLTGSPVRRKLAKPVGRESEAHPAISAISLFPSPDFEPYHLSPTPGDKCRVPRSAKSWNPANPHPGDLTGLSRIIVEVLCPTLLVRPRANDLFPKGPLRREARRFPAYGLAISRKQKRQGRKATLPEDCLWWLKTAYFFRLHLRRKRTNPTSPLPRSNAVGGRGTVCTPTLSSSKPILILPPP